MCRLGPHTPVSCEVPAFLQAPVHVNVAAVTIRSAKSRMARALFSAALTCSVVTLPRPTVAANGGVAPTESTGTVLGLEGDPQIADALTQALQDVFAARGLSSGEAMSLVELRMTMGCEGNDPACLAEGAEAMDVQKLVYGAVRPNVGGGYSVELTMLDVSRRTAERELTQEVGADQLGADALEETARRLVARLMGEDVDIPVTTQVIDTESTPPAKDTPSELVWGAYRPRPSWKYAFVGVSAGLMIASAAAAAVTTVMISPNGSIRKDLLKAAENSFTDNKPSNDIDPNMAGDLCEAARAVPPGEPGTVTNAAVTRVCNRADQTATIATATWITAGALGAATAAATILLFVRREASGMAALRQRGVRLGASPAPGGGFVSAGFRF